MMTSSKKEMRLIKMKSLSQTLKAIKEKFNTWHDKLSADTGPLQMFYTVIILLIWLYSLLLVAMFPEHSLMNLGVQAILIVYFIAVALIHFFKLNLTGVSKEPTVKAELVKQASSGPAVVYVPTPTSPALTALVETPKAEKKKVVRKPRRTKAEIEKARVLKEAKIAKQKKEVN